MIRPVPPRRDRPTRSREADETLHALEVARAFALEGEPLDAARLGSGHIHDTFAIACRGPVDYVLQRLNRRVFREPATLVENAVRVTEELHRQLARRGAGDLSRRRLRYVRTLAGDTALERDGELWRAFERIARARTFDTVASPAQARAAARAFGEFVALLAGMAPDALHLTIPGFHDFEARVEAFERAAREDARGRAAGARPEIAGMRKARERLRQVLSPQALAALPVRLVHNDCKLNNVLFDEATGEALCVIDLDTVMPGSLLLDFGDLVRTAACREPEDSTALERIRVEPDLYAAVAAGYLEGAAPVISPAEREQLPLAGPLIALETGLRFLTDHLEGDRYFRVARPEHNLQRARTQLLLTERLLDDLDGARRIVARAR